VGLEMAILREGKPTEAFLDYLNGVNQRRKVNNGRYDYISNELNYISSLNLFSLVKSELRSEHHEGSAIDQYNSETFYFPVISFIDIVTPLIKEGRASIFRKSLFKDDTLYSDIWGCTERKVTIERGVVRATLSLGEKFEIKDLFFRSLKMVSDYQVSSGLDWELVDAKIKEEKNWLYESDGLTNHHIENSALGSEEHDHGL